MTDITDRLVYVGFNSRVIALDRESGEVVWDWKSPKGHCSYVAILLDGDLLIASVQGYMYALDPSNGQQIWMNELSGMGVGYPCIASVRGSSGTPAFLLQQNSKAAATSSTTTFPPAGSM